MWMVGADCGTDLGGSTVCRLFDEGQVGDVVARFGLDHLRGDANPWWAWARVTKSCKLVNTLLMEQTVIGRVRVGHVSTANCCSATASTCSRSTEEIGQTAFDAEWADLVALKIKCVCAVAKSS